MTSPSPQQAAARWEGLLVLYTGCYPDALATARARADLNHLITFSGLLAPEDFDVETARDYVAITVAAVHAKTAARRRRAAARFIAWAAEGGHVPVDAFELLTRAELQAPPPTGRVSGEQTWEAVSVAYRRHLLEAGHTPATRRVYLQAPAALARHLPQRTLASLSVADVHGFWTHLATRCSQTSLPVMRRRTAALFDWAHEQGLVAVNVGRIALEQTHRHVRPMPTPWRRELAGFGEYLAAAGVAAGTVRVRLSHLRRLAEAVGGKGPFEVTERDLTRFVGAGQLKAESRKGVRTSMCTFYGWAHRVGRIARDPTVALPSIRVPRAHPRPVPEDVLEAALAGADARLGVMLLLGACSGLRAREIASLDVADIDLFEREMHVTGKGGVARMVPLHPLVGEELARWLGRRHGPVFPGQVQGHLSAQYVSRLLSQALGPGWTGHKLRHRFASVGYQATRDLRAMQELLGHASPATTAIYTAVSDASLRQTVAAAGIGEGPRAARAAGRF